MVWYYCEVCNKNVNVGDSTIKACNRCGHYLHHASLDKQEIERRSKERTFFCEKCGEYKYHVPVDIFIDLVRKSTRINELAIGNSRKYRKLRTDNLYKPKGPRKSRRRGQCECICFLIVIAVCLGIIIITYGIPLIIAGVIAVVYYINKKKKKEQLRSQSSFAINSLQKLGREFEFMCPVCATGKGGSGREEQSRISQVQPPRDTINLEMVICEECGSEISQSDEICMYCGTRRMSPAISKPLKTSTIKGFTKDEFKERFPEENDFYNSTEWAECRITVLKRDDYTCHFCKKRPCNTVHHLNSARKFPEMALDLENLVTTCPSCHDKYHQRD